MRDQQGNNGVDSMEDSAGCIKKAGHWTQYPANTLG